MITIGYTFCLLVLAAPSVDAPVQHIPHAAAQADLALWSRVWRGSSVQTQPFPSKVTAHRRPVFARAQDSASQQALSDLGIKAPLNMWVLARMDDATLAQALTSNAAVQLRSAPSHRPLSALSLEQIDATPVVNGNSGVMPANTGKGVLVGFVDTGLDLTHPAFKKADGSSRVVAVWDQDAESGIAPPAYGYGDSCDSTTINAGKCAIGDPEGHGTHVAGIAAGGNVVQGVASSSDIAMVRSSDFTRLADAVGFLMNLADARDQPLVVNISVGGQYGAHDGRTPLEDYLNAAARPGRILVAAAGNDGDDYIHLQATLSDTAQRVEIDGMPLDEDVQTQIDVWSDTSASVDAALELWVGGVLQSTVQLGANPTDVTRGQLKYGASLIADVSYTDAAVDGHGMVQHTVLVDRSQASYLPVGGLVALRLRGTGTVQAWITQTDYSAGYSRFGSQSQGAGWLVGDGNRSIAVPATAQAVIAVGSYTIQTSWQSQNAGEQALVGETVNGRSSFSSMGPAGYPTYTGFKPDLVAPGSVIVSARANSVQTSPDTVNSQLMVMQGTSMASPHVAGVVALMLETNPNLDPSQVRAMLRQTARSDTFTGSTPNYSWGYGKVDALAAVTAARSSAGGCAEAQATPWLVALCAAMLLRRYGPSPKRQTP